MVSQALPTHQCLIQNDVSSAKGTGRKLLEYEKRY